MFAGGDTVGEHLANLGEDPRAEAGVHMVVGPMYHTGPLVRCAAAGGRCIQRYLRALRCRKNVGGD